MLAEHCMYVPIKVRDLVPVTMSCLSFAPAVDIRQLMPALPVVAGKDTSVHSQHLEQS